MPKATPEAREAAARARNTAPSAREHYAVRTAAHNIALKATKLTAPQRRALAELAAGAPVHPGAVTPALHKRLHDAGLVTMPEGARGAATLTPLGVAYLRRAGVR
jgi:hypothetical protein